jgi:hypothetical protein
MPGQEIDYNKHVRLEFGEYVQTHEEHDNAMTDSTLGAICLGPTGREHGTHWFMCVASGARITCSRWTTLPMPKEVIQRVLEIGRLQGVPATLNRHACKIEDNLTDLDNHSDGGSYQPSESESSNDDNEFISDNDDDYTANDVDADESDDNSRTRPTSTQMPPNQRNLNRASRWHRTTATMTTAMTNPSKMQGWSQQHRMMTTNLSKTQECMNLLKTQECTDLQNTNGSHRQKRPAELQH